ncbi:MAG: hypothetical protein PHH60_06155 [Candidatus Margulisbacteria bacterium]|nr:hypothetical protein [Candidatus Margulisiibacteriota bacterium]
MSVDEVNRQLRISFSPIKLNGGYESFNYGSVDDGTDVPAHPDDAGAESRPVSAKAQKNFEFTVGTDVKVDLFQWAYIKYQIQWDMTAERKDINHDTYGCRPSYDREGNTVPICGGTPVPNETAYAVGNGSTFAYANEGGPELSDLSRLQSVSAGFYPILFQENGEQGYRERALALEAGVATKNYTLTRGWVRDGMVEIMDRQEYNLFGFTWGIYYQDLHALGTDRSLFGGISFGLKGTHFFGNSHVFSFEMSVPVGIGL